MLPSVALLVNKCNAPAMHHALGGSLRIRAIKLCSSRTLKPTTSWLWRSMVRSQCMAGEARRLTEVGRDSLSTKVWALPTSLERLHFTAVHTGTCGNKGVRQDLMASTYQIRRRNALPWRLESSEQFLEVTAGRGILLRPAVSPRVLGNTN